MIVAITGLKPFNLLKKIHFLSLSVPLMKKALVSKGNLHGHSFQNKGYFHTVTAWDTRECMMEYVYSPAHQKAIDIFEKLGEEKLVIMKHRAYLIKMKRLFIGKETLSELTGIKLLI